MGNLLPGLQFFDPAPRSRCALCALDCLECHGWDQCVRCAPSDWSSLRVLRLTDGRCRVVDLPWGAVFYIMRAPLNGVLYNGAPFNGVLYNGAPLNETG